MALDESCYLLIDGDPSKELKQLLIDNGYEKEYSEIMSIQTTSDIAKASMAAVMAVLPKVRTGRMIIEIDRDHEKLIEAIKASEKDSKSFDSSKSTELADVWKFLHTREEVIALMSKGRP